MNNTELLPCPVCGSDHFAPEVNQEDGAWSVNCYARTEGGCGLHLDGFVTKEWAIKAWNTRANIVEALKAENEELKADLKKTKWQPIEEVNIEDYESPIVGCYAPNGWFTKGHLSDWRYAFPYTHVREGHIPNPKKGD